MRLLNSLLLATLVACTVEVDVPPVTVKCVLVEIGEGVVVERCPNITPPAPVPIEAGVEEP